MSIWTWLRNTITVLHTDGSSLPDMVKFSEIPVQMTVDGGSGTGKMYAMQVALREKYLAEYSIKEIGYDIKNIFLLEKINGYFNGAIELHVALFRWLWPQLVQKALRILSKTETITE
ncbi:hypothetical protein C8J56DRAFT_893239 [Mycena floridula]|nr:hypothetical protein C8J56DRAFT_893239 [Mycena floridula]